MNSQSKLKGRNLIARKVKTMTNREFLNTIIEANINDDLTTFATNALSKLDERNAKRASVPSKTAVANAPIKEAIVNFLRAEENRWASASEVGEAVEITTQKASALLRQLVADEAVESQEQKVPKKGRVKVYHAK